MTTTGAPLTEGSVAALQRLKDGDKLLREKNRSRVYWKNDNVTLHHLTMKNLTECGALNGNVGGDGTTTFTISPVGRTLLKDHEK